MARHRLFDARRSGQGYLMMLPGGTAMRILFYSHSHGVSYHWVKHGTALPGLSNPA